MIANEAMGLVIFLGGAKDLPWPYMGLKEPAKSSHDLAQPRATSHVLT